MRSATLALAAAALIALSGTGYSAYVITHPTAAAPEVPAPMGMDVKSGEPMDDEMGGPHDWHGGTGTIPTLADALTKLERRSAIVIGSDKAFNPANGVRGGSGTFADPYQITGWYVDTILVKDTTKAFEIKDSYVGNLILDWTAQGGYVHHDHFENMRTNRNVQRTGAPSATVIENNEILRVEELRHFDGEVRNNTIGQPDAALRLLAPDVAFNIAGLNGAGIHDNQIFGGVDMKIHGHHHSDTPGRASHNHAATHDNDTYADGTKPDHQVRYVDFEFYANRVVDDRFGMRYNDLNHKGDDREATSEQNPDLEKPHVHHTTIRVHDNVIEGATLRVATVNAPDERHLAGETATLEIFNNSIVKPVAGDGITVQDVRDAAVLIHGNHVEKGPLQLSGTAAISLLRFKNSTVAVMGNDLGAYEHGVQAHDFDGNTTWSVADNQAPGVAYPVYYDSTVKNAPNEGASGAREEHDHGHAVAGLSTLGL
jgi:hypothetical protein